MLVSGDNGNKSRRGIVFIRNSNVTSSLRAGSRFPPDGFALRVRACAQRLVSLFACYITLCLGKFTSYNL